MTDRQRPTNGARRYALHPACRVRREAFGLLFYDLRGPRLLFAATGDLLAPGFFAGAGSSEDALGGVDDRRRRQLTAFLDSLVSKGFLREQPVR